MNAFHNLISLARHHRKQLVGTFLLVLAENLLLLLYPMFGAFAVNGVLAGNLSQALVYAAVVLFMWSVGSARRAVDTRTFSHIYAQMVVPVIMKQRQQGESTSTVSARVALSTELVDFFEMHLPTLITSCFSIVGAVVMLIGLEFWAGMTALVIMLLFAAFIRRYATANDHLYFRLNNRLENGGKVIQSALPHGLQRHYRLISRLRVHISDREAISYLLIGIAMAVLFGVSLSILTLKQGVTAGHIYAVVSYLWSFAFSLDDIPHLTERFSLIKDIGNRVTVEGAHQPT